MVVVVPLPMRLGEEDGGESLSKGLLAIEGEVGIEDEESKKKRREKWEEGGR